MRKDPKKYLYDISESINTIFEDYLKGIDTYEQYADNAMVRDAVERRLTVIAEALYKLRRNGITLASGDQIINRRNTMIHQYEEYNPRKIWRGIWEELPGLKAETDRLLVE